MKKILLLTIILILSGCNTFKGIGEDLQDAGIGIKNGIKDTKDTLHI